MSVARNIKHLRRSAGLNQTEFGKLFNLTRGNIDSYERSVCKPSTEVIGKIAAHYNIGIDVLLNKDLETNPGLMFINTPVESVKGIVNEDLIKAKDETIREQRRFSVGVPRQFPTT